MTVSANSTLDYQRNELITAAFQLAGLLEVSQEPSSADYDMAARFLNMELMTLQAEGVVLRSVERTTLTLVDGTATYTLPTDVIDVQFGPNDEAGTIVSTSDTETVVQAMTRAQYMNITDKTSAVSGT